MMNINFDAVEFYGTCSKMLEYYGVNYFAGEAVLIANDDAYVFETKDGRIIKFYK